MRPTQAQWQSLANDAKQVAALLESLIHKAATLAQDCEEPEGPEGGEGDEGLMAGTVSQTPVKEPVTCAHPGCRNVFVPKHGQHRFCSVRCKQRNLAYRPALYGGRRT